MNEANQEPPAEPAPPPPAKEATRATEGKSSAGDGAPDRSSSGTGTGTGPGTGHYLGFPSLPLPPREDSWFRRDANRARPSEDRMGSLRDAVPDTTTTTSAPAQRQDTGTPKPAASTAAVRFVPRTTQLENRKRKLQEEPRDPLLLAAYDVAGKDSPLIGPRLPEPPRLDMEDESMNTTVHHIRDTLKQVAALEMVVVVVVIWRK